MRPETQSTAALEVCAALSLSLQKITAARGKLGILAAHLNRRWLSHVPASGCRSSASRAFQAVSREQKGAATPKVGTRRYRLSCDVLGQAAGHTLILIHLLIRAAGAQVRQKPFTELHIECRQPKEIRLFELLMEVRTALRAAQPAESCSASPAKPNRRCHSSPA